MKVSKDINKYCISSSKKVFQALESLSKNKVNTIFIKSEDKLVGCITDGDVRRFILENGEKALNKNITENITFEKAIEELEDIIKSLEQGDVPLVDTIELYESGAKLKDFCEKKLKDAEIKIKKINENTKTKEISIEDLKKNRVYKVK